MVRPHWTPIRAMSWACQRAWRCASRGLWRRCAVGLARSALPFSAKPRVYVMADRPYVFLEVFQKYSEKYEILSVDGVCPAVARVRVAREGGVCVPCGAPVVC